MNLRRETAERSPRGARLKPIPESSLDAEFGLAAAARNPSVVPDLPTGTVTFLFTDIEGSTRLLHDLGERYADVLAEHRRALREAFGRHRGVEVDTEGDAFFVVFQRASDGLAAAAEAQRALLDTPVKVRMGLHTGEPLVAEEGYVGIDVHRAARVMAAAHGGQVLVSQPTRDLLGNQFELRDLGEHRLKDLESPERLYQLGEGEFPPVKSLYRATLPVPVTAFLGRERELADVVALLRRDDVRLLTLTGPGGTGKTRLAIEAAAASSGRYPDGVFWVGLAPLRDATLVVPAMTQAVGATDDLAAHIADRRLLLLLDNFEHVTAAAPEISHLIGLCPRLEVLATSREVLQLGGEHAYAVPTLAAGDARELFLARASATGGEVDDEEVVEELCARLDHLPLAIELAAARARLLSPAELLDRLGQRLDLLKGVRDADPRQQTLRATIAWSFELLNALEKTVFARLAVFGGGSTLEAAEAVCDADLDSVASLVDKSLIRRSADRISMLETIRQFALEQLRKQSDVRDLQRKHALHYLALAERAEPDLRGPAQRRWLERLELDHDNLRAALSWSREAGGAEVGLRLAAALWRFWRMHHLTEGSRVLETFLRMGETGPASLRTRALLGASRLAMDEGDLERTLTRAEEALTAARASGAAREIAAATENLGLMMMVTGSTDRALALLEESIARFRALGDPVGTADALNNLANALLAADETGRAAEYGKEALALQRDAGNAFGMAFVLNTLGYVALHERDLELSSSRLEESLVLFQELGDVSRVGDNLEGLAQVAAGRGDDRRAVVLWSAGESFRAEAGKHMEPSEAALHEDALSRARTRMGEPAFAVAWIEGAALTAEDAVAYALQSGTNASPKQNGDPVPSR
jgi:predicted ATPase/class 3 adenylate cyclase